MLTDLSRGIERIRDGIAAEWAIYIKFMASGEVIRINADVPVDTMSVIKIPLLVTLYRLADAGRIDLDQRIVLETRHKRFGTGSLRSLTDGLTLTLRDAATLMIIQSDNTATDMCFEQVGGPSVVNETMRELGLRSIHAVGTAFDWFSALAASMDPALGPLGPEALFRAGYPPMAPDAAFAARQHFHFETPTPYGIASAADIGLLLEMIWRGQCAQPDSCAAMQQMLRLQQSRARIPKYLINTSVANKTGDFDPFIANDAGVIEPSSAPPIIACFFASQHRGLWANLEDAIARMSEKVWEYGLHLADATETQMADNQKKRLT